MSGAVEAEASRPRPLSGGLWTLFSWLRRDERCSSSESLSSAGSDRTAASFAFLAPAHYRTTAPLILPPTGPPTDSYKKRVLDRNLRRQHDRNITLHRKYGLFRSEGVSGYDAFSLPPARRANGDCRDRTERERRAISECLQGRVVHVPGKRRAPLPPIRALSAAPSTTLSRRHNRKRPAPQPPVNLQVKPKEHTDNLQHNNTNKVIQMNSQSLQDKQQLENNDISTGCKSEKYCKKDANTKTDVKNRSEKNFIKQIFENRKRNSAIETTSVKLLPSISELDKQAAEIIEQCKLKERERNNNEIVLGNTNSQGLTQSKSSKGETWICTRCLRKYNASVITCIYCIQVEKSNPNVLTKDKICKNINYSNNSTQTKNCVASTSRSSGVEDKQKLKEMLKEMKDSLPKRPKHDSNEILTKNIDTNDEKTKVIEMPTLRIGSFVPKDVKTASVGHSMPDNLLKNEPSSLDNNINSKNNVSLTHNVVLTNAAHSSDIIKFDKNKLQESANNLEISKILLNVGYTEKNLHTPLKISSLLNPVYIPKNIISESPEPKSFSQILSKDLILPKDTIRNNVTMIKTYDDLLTSTPIKSILASTSQSSSTSSIKMLKEEELELRKPVDIIKKHKEKQQSTPNEQFAIVKPAGDSIVTSPEPTTEIHNPKNIVSKTEITVDKETHIKPSAKINAELKKVLSNNPSIASSSNKNRENNHIIERLDQHSRRRDLINQLEQSIAKGDERAAADAAVKLAQLRLSCSVLSFTSQIVSDASTSSSSSLQDTSKGKLSNNYNVPDIKNEKSSKSNSTTTKVDQLEVTNELTSILKSSETTPSLKVSESTNGKPPTSDNKDGNYKILLNKASTSLKPIIESKNDMVSIAVWVEDREAARGPVNLLIQRNAIMSQLRRQAEISLGLASRMQRWIVGRVLCTDDNTPLATLAGSDFSAPFYLCLVESGSILETASCLKTSEGAEKDSKIDNGGNVYTELVKLEKQAFVPNAEAFECEVCIEQCPPGKGVVLRECVHSFCRECLSDVIHHCEEPAVSCPAMGCRGILQEREIRALVSPEDYERWLARGLTAAESGTRNAFHCRTRDCTGWALCEAGVQRFPCPVCKHTNCVPCQAIHDGENCEQYRAKVKKAASKDDSNQTDEGTRALLNTLITRGEALECPECNAIITKKWGCDWIKCSACKTEICWVTRGRRWGPGGRGDTTGGCRCGIDGKRCHPSCGYCH